MVSGLNAINTGLAAAQDTLAEAAIDVVEASETGENLGRRITDMVEAEHVVSAMAKLEEIKNEMMDELISRGEGDQNNRFLEASYSQF